MADNAILSELTYQTNEGALRFEGVRYLLIRPETLASVQEALEAGIGAERAGEILYAGGFTGGKLSGRKYKESFGLSDREAVEFMCRMGGEIGWGHFRLVELDAQTQRLVVAVESSPFAEAYRQPVNVGQRSPAGICHLIRGVLGGLAEGIFGVPVHARETQCQANRNPYCQFETVAQ